MSYPSYLIHYNKNHSKANGQFVSGDGDGDGVVNDHANQKKQLTPEEKKKRAKRNAWIAVGAAAAGTAVAATALIITRNKNKKLADTQEKIKLGKSFANAAKINNTPLLSATAWTQEKVGTNVGNITRKEYFEAPKRWNAAFNTTGYGNSDVRIFDVKSPAKGTWGKNRTWGWD